MVILGALVAGHHPLTPRERALALLPAEATILEAPSEDAEGAFATVVGRYAGALDRGDDPGDAFTTASSELGWMPVGSE